MLKAKAFALQQWKMTLGLIRKDKRKYVSIKNSPPSYECNAAIKEAGKCNLLFSKIESEGRCCHKNCAQFSRTESAALRKWQSTTHLRLRWHTLQLFGLPSHEKCVFNNAWSTSWRPFSSAMPFTCLGPSFDISTRLQTISSQLYGSGEASR